jgi:hypothetical protein
VIVGLDQDQAGSLLGRLRDAGIRQRIGQRGLGHLRLDAILECRDGIAQRRRSRHRRDLRAERFTQTADRARMQLRDS